MDHDPQTARGRGAAFNPANRFELFCYEYEAGATPDPDGPALTTRFFRDQSRTVLAHNDSPDVGFDTSLNPYRGCEHGCAYCYARPTHEYLGFSAGLDFESRIMIKDDAPELLRRELAAPGWRPRVVSLCGVTDAYQPVERRLRLTRRCLEVFAEFRNPVTVITKNGLVARDRDLLADLARDRAAAVCLSVTTLDADLAGRLEPRASRPAGRLAAVAELAAAGVPVGVMVGPVIPGLTDHELPAILRAAAQAGARFAGYTLLRLPLAVGPLFDDWLRRHCPDRREKVLGRVRATRGGVLNDARFGSRMRGEGELARQLRSLFALGCRRAGLSSRFPELSATAFRRPGGTQQLLFE
jgi:DNA repair photolyase